MSIRTNSDNQPWHDLPPDIQHALKAAYEEFEELRIRFGHATQTLCCDYAHGTRSDDHEACMKACSDWYTSLDVDRANTWYFRFAKLTHETLSYAFRTCFDFYIEVLTEEARRVFAGLIEIGVKNESRLKQDDSIEWARAHAMQMIRNLRNAVMDWIKAACDRDVVDPWRAPELLTMEPAGSKAYDAERVWKPMDAASTSELLNSFADELNKLESFIRKDAREVYKKAAIQPRPVGPMFEGKLTKESEPAAQESQEDADDKKWKRISKKVKEGRPIPVNEAAYLLECSLKTIYNRVTEGDLRKAGPGKITAASLEKYIDGADPKNTLKPREPL